MKNINKIMFACLLFTIGYVQAGDDSSTDNSSNPAMEGPMVGTSSATHSPTQPFTVVKGLTINGQYYDTTTFTGSYNPVATPAKATINDSDGNILFTFVNVTNFQPRTREHMALKELNGKQLIGAISSTAKTSANGKIKSHAMMLDSLLFGELKN